MVVGIVGMEYRGCDACGRIYRKGVVTHYVKFGEALDDERLDLCRDCFKAVAKSIRGAVAAQRAKLGKK